MSNISLKASPPLRSIFAGDDGRIQSTLTTESPNPAAEQALTTAIADMVHSLGHPFTTVSDPKFKRVITLAKYVPSTYKAPSRQEVSGELLKLNYQQLIKRQLKTLKDNAEDFGLTLYGDGATVKKMPLLNILASGYGVPAAVLEIVDCTGHMAEGGKKDATYIASLFKPHMRTLDPEKRTIDLL
jgi:hypothetical protein